MQQFFISSTLLIPWVSVRTFASSIFGVIKKERGIRLFFRLNIASSLKVYSPFRYHYRIYNQIFTSNSFILSETRLTMSELESIPIFTLLISKSANTASI